MATATTQAPTSTSSSSTTVVRPSSVPPAAPKAIPASAVPRRPALAAETREGDTRQRQVRQGRKAPSQRHQAPNRTHQPSRDEGKQQRQGQPVGGAGRLEQAVLARLDHLPAQVETRPARLDGVDSLAT